MMFLVSKHVPGRKPLPPEISFLCLFRFALYTANISHCSLRPSGKMNRIRHDPRQSPRYERPMSPHRDTSESCLPRSRTSRLTRNSSPLLSFRIPREDHPPSRPNPTFPESYLPRSQTSGPTRNSSPLLSFRQPRDRSLSRPKSTFYDRARTPDRVLHVPTGPRRKSPPTLSCRQEALFKDKEQIQQNRPFASSRKAKPSVLSAVTPPMRQDPFYNQAKAFEVGFQNTQTVPPTGKYSIFLFSFNFFSVYSCAL